MTDSLDALREEAREILRGESALTCIEWKEAALKLASALAALPREPRKNADGLLPCPLCNGTRGSPIYDETTDGFHRISCYGCNVHVLKLRKAEAYEVWNTRAAVPEDRAETDLQRGNRLAREEAERRGIGVDPRLAGKRATSAPEARGGLIERALCQSGTFETGQGTCALICMDQLGDVRKKGCCHANKVHGKLAATILAALSPRPDGEPEAGQEVKRG